MSLNNQEDDRKSGPSDSAFVTSAKVLSARVVAASRLAHRVVEFFGKHPFVTGLLAVIGVLGFAISIEGYLRDREDARMTSIQVGRVEETLETIQSEIRDGETLSTLHNSPPEWVTKGCMSYFRDADPERYCGTGSARGIRDVARQKAIMRGRAEIAQTLQTSIDVSIEPGTEEIESSTNAILSGAKVLEVWASPEGEVHALVVYYDSSQTP